MGYEEFFIIMKGENKTKCLACNKLLSGVTSSNVKRHYKLMHQMEIRKRHKGEGDDKELPIKRPKLLNTRNQFLKCCLGLVATKNIPLHIFDDEEHFKALLAPHEKKFRTNLNSRNIVSLIECSSARIRDIITQRMKTKLVSLIVDVASKLDKSILIISVQYIDDFKICCNTLGIIQLQRKSKASYIREEILRFLHTYEIDASQIYSSTINNAVNAVEVGELLQVPQDEFTDEERTDSTIIDSGDEHISSLASELPTTLCAVHTIQLAAYDVLIELEPQITECRSIVKWLRTFARSNSCEIQMPVLDNTTRWNSTYEMLRSMLLVETYIDTLVSKLDIQLKINWDFVTNCTRAFGPLAMFTNQLQTEQYILGDFYRDWLNCELELCELVATTPYASLLQQAMQTRREELLQSDVFISALYLDPRFNFANSVMLSEEQKTRAVAHLLKTFELIRNRDTSPDDGDDVEFKYDVDTPQPTTSKSVYAKLEQHINNMSANPSATLNSQRTLRQNLILLPYKKMESLDANILEFWKSNSVYSNVTRTLKVALAVPATHLSAGRTLNALSLISTKLQSKLDTGTINNLLLTKLNFAEIHSDDVELKFEEIGCENLSANFSDDYSNESISFIRMNANE